MHASGRSIVVSSAALVALLLLGLMPSFAQAPASGQAPATKGKTSPSNEPASLADRASASVNFAMAAFRRMMGDLALNDPEKAAADRNAAAVELGLAVTAYTAIASTPGEHRTNALVQTDQRTCDTEYIRRQAAAYAVKLPVSQQDALTVTIKLLQQVQASLASFDAALAAKDARMRQTIEQQVDATLLFLSCTAPPA